MAMNRTQFDAMIEKHGLELGLGTTNLAWTMCVEHHLNETKALERIRDIESAFMQDYDEAMKHDQKAEQAAEQARKSRPTSRVMSRAVPEEAPERAKLFARHVANLAAATVSLSRRSLFGDSWEPLTTDAARKLLKSRALSIMSRAELRERGIPLDGGHTSSLRHLGSVGTEITVSWSRHRRVVETFSNRPETLRVQLPGEGVVFAWHGSFLGELSRAARYIGQLYGWSEPEGITFLIEGQTPALDALRVETATTFDDKNQVTQAWITVRAMPHVLPEEVASAFRGARTKLGFGGGRPIEPRNLALLKFVEGNARIAWPELLAQWNAKWSASRPEWQYEFPSRMRRDHDDSARRVYMLGLRPGAGDRVLQQITLLGTPPRRRVKPRRHSRGRARPSARRR